MSHAPDHTYLINLAGKLLSKIATRDNVHLGPTWLTRAAAKCLKTGLRKLESFLKRMLMVMALALEPDLKPTQKEYAPTRRKAPRKRTSKAALRLNFTPKDPPAHLADLPRKPKERAHLVPARPFIDLILALQSLIEAPETRARRLAFHLARNRPGLILAPDLDKRLIGNKDGTDLSAVYHALSHKIITLSRARPPPLGPVPRAPPRLRTFD